MPSLAPGSLHQSGPSRSAPGASTPFTLPPQSLCVLSPFTLSTIDNGSWLRQSDFWSRDSRLAEPFHAPVGNFVTRPVRGSKGRDSQLYIACLVEADVHLLRTGQWELFASTAVRVQITLHQRCGIDRHDVKPQELIGTLRGQLDW